MSVPAAFQLKVVTPRRLLCDVAVESASIPTLDGFIGILPGHRSLYTAVGRGRLTYVADGIEEGHWIRGGFVQVLDDEVVVMTEMSEDEPNQSAQGRG